MIVGNKMLHRWVTMAWFEEYHDVKHGHVLGNINKKLLPKSVVKKMGKTLYVDELFFTKRKNFRLKIWNENHQLYYFMMTSMEQMALARLLDGLGGANHISWDAFLRYGLFAPDNLNLVSCRVPDMQWIFNRHIKAIVRQAFRAKGVPAKGRDLNKLILKGSIEWLIK